MSQSRYFNAFLISTLVFFVLYFIFLSLSDIKKIVKPAATQVIKIALITPTKKIVKPVDKATPLVTPIIPPVIVKKIVKRQVIKEVKPNKVAKKKIVKKKIIKKKIRPKKVLKKKTVKKRIIKEPVKIYVQIPPKPTLKPIKIPNKVLKNNHLRKAFIRNFEAKIIANKKYPRIAIRRHIQGSIKVRFDLTRYAQVTNIRLINGKSIFYKEVKKTLRKTFPVKIPNNIKDELPMLDITVTLHFNFR